jgi:hypothetical protein
MNRYRPMLALAGALAMLLGSSLASAQPVEDAPLRYRVRSGDTLISLATNYLTRKDDYKTIQSMNRIADPYRLPIGSTLLIPERLLRTEPVLGEITSFRGDVKIDNQPAKLKMQIRQGMQIETGASSSLTVEFPDDTAISLPSQSRIRIDRLRRVLLTDALDRNFRLLAGKTQSRVTPMTNPDSNFRVTTPLSVSAVRGTDFRVGFDEESGQSITETVGGLVGVAPDEEKDEVGVPVGYGVIGTKEGIQPPVKLLAGPELTGLGRGDGDTLVVTYKAVEGAKKYRVQITADQRYREVINEALTDELTASFPGIGSRPFFVQLTSIDQFGLEGVPTPYQSGRKSAPSSGGSASSSGSQTSMIDDAQINPAINGTNPAIR